MSDLPNEVREAFEIQRAALLEARATFQEYVRLHRAKSPPDEAKAQANFEQADKIGMALAKSDAVLSALEAAGWVCVPKHPTVVMVNAGRSTQYEDGSLSLYDVWQAMLTASNPKEKPDV